MNLYLLNAIVNPDGSYTETVTLYDVNVADVNHCDILNAKGNVISSFSTEHYYKHGSPDSGSQFELTSNYIRCEDQSGNSGGILIKSTGEYVTPRDDPATNYTLIEADTAVFDVKMLMKPVTETVTRYNAAGEPVDSPQTSNAEDHAPLTIDSVVFHMDHQSVIDAHNKCPAHTELDFTLNADLNEILTDKKITIILSLQLTIAKSCVPDSRHKRTIGSAFYVGRCRVRYYVCRKKRGKKTRASVVSATSCAAGSNAHGSVSYCSFTFISFERTQISYA